MLTLCQGLVLPRLRQRLRHVCDNREFLRVLRGTLQRRRRVSPSTQRNHRRLRRGQTLLLGLLEYIYTWTTYGILPVCH